MYHNPFYNAVNKEYIQDINFYLECCQKYGHSVLEACCGNGRVSLPLKLSGVNISGFDRSVTMLNAARDRATTLGVSIPFYEQDALTLDLGKKYDLILMPFNSLQYFYTLSDQKQVLQNIKKHLTKDGRFIFDVFNPKIYRIVEGENCERFYKKVKLSNGSIQTIYEKLHYVSDKQVLCSQWRIFENGKNQMLELDSHCYYPFELRLLLESQGFLIEHVYGSFDKEPFDKNSSKQIVVCRIC